MTGRRCIAMVMTGKARPCRAFSTSPSNVYCSSHQREKPRAPASKPETKKYIVLNPTTINMNDPEFVGWQCTVIENDWQRTPVITVYGYTEKGVRRKALEIVKLAQDSLRLDLGPST